MQPDSSVRPVLVTGGAGFIGSNLVDRLLAEGHRVVVVDDLSTGRLANLAAARAGEPGIEFHRLDVTSGGLDKVVARARPRAILHLAAQIDVRASVEDPRADATANILGTIEVLEAARRHGVDKVVLASSGGTIYGAPALEDLPIAEDHPGIPLSPYGASKRCAEEYLRMYGALHGLRWTSLALANVYGPRQDPAGEAGVVAIFTDGMLDGLPVRVHGTGEQTRDFVFVEDVVSAFVLALDAGDGERFNIGTGERTSVNALFRGLAAVTGYHHEPLQGEPRMGEALHSALATGKAARELGWKPWTTLEEGLAATLRWARAQRTED